VFTPVRPCPSSKRELETLESQMRLLEAEVAAGHPRSATPPLDSERRIPTSWLRKSAL
jgi:hypothetical protein